MFFSGNKLILAPLAGITDHVFRLLCKENGADIVVSEMVSAEGINYNAPNTESLLHFTQSERPIGIQLFGSDPVRLAEAAARVEELVKPDFIDLNSGCPVPKVVKRNGGAALLRNLELFSSIVKAMSRAISIPLTVKIRSGWHKGDWVDTEFALAAQENGAAALTLHPRSQTMLFSGHSFWERIAIVKQAVKIPVIGNGDICTPQDAIKMINETGCDSIMIGRAAMGNPWIFARIKHALAGNTEELCITNWKEIILRHIALFRDLNGEYKAGKEMKKQVAWYMREFAGASALRDKIFRAQSSTELEDIVKSIDEESVWNTRHCAHC